MKSYFIYLRAKWQYRKEIKQNTRDFLLRTGALMENKVQKLVKTDFTGKLNYQPQTKLTEQDMIDYLKCKKMDVDKIIKQKMETS
tara:strand:+ start:47 stop:301 length:255 start_codon:yes stop_codon:yes gene_type:complete